MDREIIETIDKRRKRVPKHLEPRDLALLKDTADNALDFNADGPVIILGYRDPNNNAVDYYNIRTGRDGRASVTNLKLLQT